MKARFAALIAVAAVAAAVVFIVFRQPSPPAPPESESVDSYTTRLLVEQPERTVAIVGGVLLDLSRWGQGTADMPDAVVVFRGDSILAVGSADDVRIPPDALRIDAGGKWIVPGLIDGFAVLNNQAYADSYLAMGVTSLIGVSGGRRGSMFLDADPGPRIFPLESVGDEPMASDDIVLAAVDALAAAGIRVALLMYGLTPYQLRMAHERAREHGMATIGELGAATYADGNGIGLDAFVHTTRYSLDAAPHEMAAAVAAEPFSDDLESPKWQYYRWLAGADPEALSVSSNARRLGRGPAALIPTLSLLYLDMAEHENPWSWPTAEWISPGDVNAPADPATGAHDYDEVRARAYADVARGVIELERLNHAAGAHYVAGSATDVWGTMPGISLHTELELLTRIGLSPREALAAATSSSARTFGFEGIGTIEPGGRADIVILDADPTLDLNALRNPHLVIAAGRLVRRSAAPHPAIAQVTRDTIVVTETGATIERVDYQSEGHEVFGYLATPAGSGPFPVIVRLRGGNRSFGAYSPERAVRSLGQLAEWGYVAIAPQYRGATDPEEGDSADEFGGADVADIFTMIDLLPELESAADTSRIGLDGWSRGGMMALLALRRSDGFRAAVLVGSMSDLERMAADRPVMLEVYDDLFGTPDSTEFQRRVRERSGVYWTDELPIDTPVLILHGGADWRVSPQQSLDLASGLQAAGRFYRIVVVPGADHSLSDAVSERDEERRAWFDRYVRDLEPVSRED